MDETNLFEEQFYVSLKFMLFTINANYIMEFIMET